MSERIPTSPRLGTPLGMGSGRRASNTPTPLNLSPFARQPSVSGGTRQGSVSGASSAGLANSNSGGLSPVMPNFNLFSRSDTKQHKRTSSEPAPQVGAGIGTALREGIGRIISAASPRLGSVAQFGGSPAADRKRPFFKDDPPQFNRTVSGQLPIHARVGGRRPSTAISTARAVVIRPFYLLFRRGPILPIFLLITFIFLLGGFSSSDDDDSLDDLKDPYAPAAVQAVTLTAAPEGAVGRFMAAAGVDRLPAAKDLIPANPVGWARARWAGLAGAAEAVEELDEWVGDEDALWVTQKKPAQQEPLAKIDPAEVVQPVRPPVAERKKKPLRRRDGRALILEGQEHPIHGLIRRGKKRWAALKSRQSKTFAQAVKEYKRRYGIAPPKGFDRW